MQTNGHAGIIRQIGEPSAFVPSIDEGADLVICGNAMPGGSKLNYDEGVIKIRGIERKDGFGRPLDHPEVA